jgi:hypothetical protein
VTWASDDDLVAVWDRFLESGEETTAAMAFFIPTGDALWKLRAPECRMVERTVVPCSSGDPTPFDRRKTCGTPISRGREVAI